MNGYDCTIFDEESGYTLAPCNECGKLVPQENELCCECGDKLIREQEEEAMHPEWRCPPRE